MKTTSQTYVSNGIMFLTASTILALIGGLISDWLLAIGLCINVVLIVMWSLNYKFNVFMDNKIKVLNYIKYDFKNEPISYFGLFLCWCTVGVWFCRDMSQYGAVDFDVLLGLFCIYVVTCVMVFWGYFKDYDRLP